MLEQIVYESPRVSEKQIYSVGDLEYLSASELYTGKLPSMGPGGFGVLPKLSGYSVISSGPSGKLLKGPSGKLLTIRDFPTMQLHIHEKDGFITGASIKGKGVDGGKVNLSNYEAAMADLYSKMLADVRNPAIDAHTFYEKYFEKSHKK